MTRDEILNMPAGREMDALVAEKVMNHLHLYEDVIDPYDGRVLYQRIAVSSIQNYSTDISAAWEVVEKFDYYELKQLGKECQAYLENGNKSGIGNGESMPLAICRAALLTTIGDEK